MKRSTLFAFCLLFFAVPCIHAQTPDDGFWMEPGQICIAVPYSFDSWDEYWEGELLRDNQNIGTFKRQSVMPMFALGLIPNLNVIVSLPYVWTSSTGGSVTGQEGVQDFSLWLKWRPGQFSWEKSRLDLSVVGGFSTPASNYYPDYLPFSIGLASTNLTGQGIVHFEMKKGWFATLTGGYTTRSNIELERDHYYSGGQAYYTNEMDMPDLATGRLALGFVNARIKTDAFVTVMNTLGGDDIRRQDMPLPNNNMDQTRVGAEAQYYFAKIKGLSVIGFGSYAVAGRNVGQSTNFGGGIAYQFGIWKPRAQ